MSSYKRITTETRGVRDWRERLASPDTQWKKNYSVMEAAVSWEAVSKSKLGLPDSIADLFCNSQFGEAELLLAVAEHKVPLAGQGWDSQCDVWALLHSESGQISLSVEAKAKEGFGQKTLQSWLKDGGENREVRRDFVLAHLPANSNSAAYLDVAYQLLHRCAAAVIEAKWFRLSHAAFIVQAFNSPAKTWNQFEKMCSAMAIANVQKGQLYLTSVGSIQLAVGWVDCAPALDEQISQLL